MSSLAVIGKDAAAKVFVDALAKAVGTITGDGGILEKLWWLLLVLLAVILISLVLDAQKPVDGSEVEMNTKTKDLPEKLRDLQVGDDEGQVIF